MTHLSNPYIDIKLLYGSHEIFVKIEKIAPTIITPKSDIHPELIAFKYLLFDNLFAIGTRHFSIKDVNFSILYSPSSIIYDIGLCLQTL